MAIKNLNSCGIWLLFGILLFFKGLAADEIGTLNMTLHTDGTKENLDRVRFWLKNEKNEWELYPKADYPVNSEQSGFSKTVVVSLTPGNYQIEFLIPNHRKLYDQVPPASITIHPNEILRMEQMIHLKQTKQAQVVPSKNFDQVLAFLKNDMKPGIVQKLEEGALNHPMINLSSRQGSSTSSFIVNQKNDTNFQSAESLNVPEENLEKKESNEGINSAAQSMAILSESSSKEVLSTNAPLVLKVVGPTHIIITSPKNKKIIVEETVDQNYSTFQLPEGHYLLTYQRLDDPASPAKSMYVTVHHSLPRTIEL